MRKPQHYRALQDFMRGMTRLILPFHISLSTFTAFRRLFHGVVNSIETTAKETAKQTVNDCMRLRSDKTIGGLKHQTFLSDERQPEVITNLKSDVTSPRPKGTEVETEVLRLLPSVLKLQKREEISRLNEN